VVFIHKNERAKEKYKQPTILKIPDRLWNAIKNIFPNEKSLRTVGSRPTIPYRKVIDGTLCAKNRMSMEDATKRIWIGFYM
jgi:hypothetical protein